MELSLIEELAWKEHVQQLYLAAKNYQLLAASENDRFREYLKGKYEPQKQEFT